MKRSRKEKPTIFANNLYKSRMANDWSQQKAADLLGIPRATYGSYEEGRAEPGIEFLKHIVSIFSITNLLSFLDNPRFDPKNQDKDFSLQFQSQLDKIYGAANANAQGIVDLALGIRSKEVTC